MENRSLKVVRLEADLAIILPVVGLLKGPNLNELVALVSDLLPRESSAAPQSAPEAGLVEVGEF